MAGNRIRGPQRGLAQEIGQEAADSLHAHKPRQWDLGQIGGNDYGFDYQVTVFGPGDSGAQLYFNLQLKGTTQADSRLADGLHISHAFDLATLRLWNSTCQPVLIVIADLIDDRDPLKATVYFDFVSPRLDDLLLAAKLDQATLTIRVLRASKLNRDLDILPVIGQYLDELADVRRQLREQRLGSGATPDTVAKMSVYAHAAQATGLDVAETAAAIELVIAGTERAAEMAAALTAIRSGDAARALELTWDVSNAGEGAPTAEVAVNAYLRAKALEFIGDRREVGRLLGIAHAALPDNDDVVGALAQYRLEEISFGEAGRSARNLLLGWLAGYNGPSVCTVVAKLHSLNGHFDEARQVLQSVPANKRAITSLVVSVVQADWPRVLSEAAKFRASATLTQVQSLSVLVMEARAHFQQALGPTPWPDNGDFIIPSAGLPYMDMEAMRRAYDASVHAMQLAQVLRWPATTQHLLDVFPISAMVLGKIDQAMPLLAALGQARAGDESTREAVMKVALNADQPALVLQLAELAKDSSRFKDEDALSAVAACRVGNVARAFAYITPQTLAQTDESDIFLSTLMIIGVAADAAMRSDMLELIRSRLGQSKEGRHFLAILDSAVQVRLSVLQRSEAVQQLYVYWEQHGRPVVVANHLLINADPTSQNEAQLIRCIAEAMHERHSLDSEQWANYAQALLTLGVYSDAVQQLRLACSRYSAEPRLASLLAIALELNGDGPEAFERFEALVESGEASETARRYFINSAARIGYLDKAEAQVRAALSRSSDRRVRLRHLNTLFQLALLSSPPSAQLWDLAWEYGRLADRKDEREEGIFLQEAIAALTSFQPGTDDVRLQEYAHRRDAFCEAFPDSTLLRHFELPKDGSADAIAKAIQEATGVTDADLRRGEKLERGMDAGTLPVPFSWRPREFLRNVPDVLALWLLRRSMPLDRRAWHFDTHMNDFSRNVPHDLASWEPVLSLTSLLVLSECGLLAMVLERFPRVVVARASLIELQNASNPVTAGYGREQAERILATLRGQFAKVIHPPLPMQQVHTLKRAWHEEEKAAMAAPGRVYFCDDIIETIMVCSADGDLDRPQSPSISLVDFLTWADKVLGSIGPQEVAEHIAQLIQMKIGVVVEARYLVAAIPASLQLASSRETAEQALASANTLRTILDGLWTPSVPWVELRRHFSAVMSYLLTTGKASDAVLETLWLRWLQAIRLQTEPALLPIERLASAFVAMLMHVTDTAAISRLWRTYWAAIEVGGLSEAEADRAGVLEVARALGTASATGETLIQASDVSQRARAGLGSGTELVALYERSYVEAAAIRASRPA